MALPLSLMVEAFQVIHEFFTLWLRIQFIIITSDPK